VLKAKDLFLRDMKERDCTVTKLVKKKLRRKLMTSEKISNRKELFEEFTCILRLLLSPIGASSICRNFALH